MNYLITLKTDEGRLHVINQIFCGLPDAKAYCATIDLSREPTIIPYIKMIPRRCGEFTSDDYDEMAEILEDIWSIFMFSYDGAGAAPMAEPHVIQAYNHISNAVQSLKLAALVQARELGGR